MSTATAGWLQLGLLVAALAACYVPIGNYMAHIFTTDKHWRVERGCTSSIGVNPENDQKWSSYVRSVLAFSLISVLFLYGIERLQQYLLLSEGMKGVPPALAWNTAASFVTNTNWQNYSGESTMGYLTQMSGLAVQNFMSAAVGIVIAIALVRGFMRSKTDKLGNFWVDTTRITIRYLIPLAVVGGIILMASGVIDNLSSYHTVTTLSGAHQTIVGGPVASQEVIKDAGNNGGGFFNANSAHPFENPNPFTNWFEIFLLLLTAFCLPRTFGKMVKDNRQGYALLAVMVVIWLAAVGGISFFETQGAGLAPQLAHGAMEGKNVVFGTQGSSLFAASTTVTSTGSVNSFHDSFTAFGGGIADFDIALGEVAPGGVGAGLYGILILAMVTVFVGGLMVGRTPEYIGKKIRPTEMKYAALYFLTLPVTDPDSHRTVDRAEDAAGVDTQPRPARPDGDPVRVHIDGEQQWLGLRRADDQHRLVQHGRRDRDADRQVRSGDLRARPGRIPGQTATRARKRGHARYQEAAVRRHARRRHPHPRRPDLLPRTRPRPVRRRTALMSVTTTPDAPMGKNLSDGQPHRVSGGSLLSPGTLWKATPDAFKKLDPRVQIKNPVMFVVEVGALLTLYTAITNPSIFNWTIVVWLWLTVVFANMAEAVAEGRGKAQAETLRKTKRETVARRLVGWQPGQKEMREEPVPGTQLTLGDYVVVEAGEIIPGDGDVVEGVASVDESAITGESAPVIRESGGDRSAVTGGTKVLSDRIVVKITSKPGETFIDRMIALVEGAKRQKTPNEIALNILLAALTIIFMLAVVTLQPMAFYSGAPQSLVILVALLVALIPTTIGALLSAIGIAGMDRLVQRNVLAMSGRAVEAAGDVNTLLLDKTGTITIGNRQATEFLPVQGVTADELANAAQLSSMADYTPEGRSIAVLAKEKYGLRERAEGELQHAEFVEFTAQTRMSGIDLADGREVRKGAAASVAQWVRDNGGTPAEELGAMVDGISGVGGTPLVVAEQANGTAKALGVIYLKDIVKEGIAERFAEMRRMGIRTVMITGDNPLTAKAIADESGVDDFLAEATPEDKMALIKKEQEGGKLVAMTGDGTNDAPALAQADVGVAMNTGTSAAKEAGNMVDLDSNPTKLIEIVEIGKQLLITRGALTTFSITNDVAKYFAIIPAMFASVIPGLAKLNILHLHSPQSAITSAIIFNALIIVALIPLALRGVRYRPSSAAAMLRRNLWIYGVGGLIIPFIGIKAIDLIIQFIPGFR